MRSFNLHAGETEAISLALELRIPAILLDDAKASCAAISCGLEPMGTLAILVRAGAARLLNLENSLLRLRATNFRIGPATIGQLIADAHKRG